MKKALEWITQWVREAWLACSKAASVSLRPFRTGRRLLNLQSQNFELNSNNEELQCHIESLERNIKHLNKDLRQAWRELAESRKQILALKNWIVIAHRIDIPRKAGAIDQLIFKSNEIKESLPSN